MHFWAKTLQKCAKENKMETFAKHKHLSKA